MGWVVFLGLVGMFLGVLAWRILAGRRRGYTAVVEYWVYSNVEKLPPTPAIMDAVIGKNPHNRPDRPCITQREGTLFTDLRLHLAIAKREKNPHAFRPDLFEEHAEPDADVLGALADCKTIAKLRYLSNETLPDRRHLQFMTHLADTMARMTRSRIVYDTVSERFWKPAALYEELQSNNDAERADLHVRTVWAKSLEGCRAETLGLRKVGLDELETELQEHDQELLVREVLQAAAERLFLNPAQPLPFELSLYGDRFEVSEVSVSEGRRRVKIVRRMLR